MKPSQLLDVVQKVQNAEKNGEKRLLFVMHGRLFNVAQFKLTSFPEVRKSNGADFETLKASICQNIDDNRGNPLTKELYMWMCKIERNTVGMDDRATGHDDWPHTTYSENP